MEVDKRTVKENEAAGKADLAGSEAETSQPAPEATQSTAEEKKQEAEAFAKAAVCVSSQAHGRPVKQEKEAEHGEEAGKAENTEADRPQESQGADNSRAEGAGQPAEPSEERPRPESENTVAVSLDEEGDDDDDDFADDADWQSFQQSQKQVG